MIRTADFGVTNIVGKILERRNQWHTHSNDQGLGKEVDMGTIEPDPISYGKRDFKLSLDLILEHIDENLYNEPPRMIVIQTLN